MSVLIAKSKENILSARILIDNKCYASSIHCSYYSSFQIMSHLMLSKLGLTTEKINASSKDKGGSHIFTAGEIFTELKKQGEVFKALDFNRDIGVLRNKRAHADYSNEMNDKVGKQLDKDYCENALSQAGKINEMLTKVFKLAI